MSVVNNLKITDGFSFKQEGAPAHS